METRNLTRYTLWAVFAATLAVRVGFGAVMPGLPIYVEQHGMGTDMIAMMANAYMVANALFQGYAGHLGDRFGRRPMMLIGTWLYTLAAAGFLLNVGPWSFVVLRGLEGLGAAAFGPAARAYLADLVPESERGKVYAQLNSFDMAGLLLGPLFAGPAQAIGGAKGPFAFCALLGLLAGVPLVLLTRRTRAQAQNGIEHTPSASAAAAVNVSTIKLLSAPAFWAVALPGIGFAYLNGLYSVVWSLYMQQHGATPWLISLSFTAFALPMVLFMVPFGRLADRVGRPLLIAIGGVGSTIATLCYGIFPNPYALNAFCVLDGTSSAMFAPASQAFMAEVAPPSMRGKFMGLVGASSTVATVAAVSGIGYLYQHTSPIVLFALGAVSLLFGCGSAVIIMVRRPAAGLRRQLEELSA